MNTSSELEVGLLFSAYRNAGLTLDLVIPVTVFYIVGMIGVTMNTFVIYITIQFVHLRSGTANYLMALLCFFEILHQSGHTYFFLVIISGTNFVRLSTAQLFAIPQLVGINGAIITMLCAAVDRLFAVAFPSKHKKMLTLHKKLYLSVYTLICTAYSVYCLQYVIYADKKIAEKPITGCICDILSDDSVRDQFAFLSCSLNLACICCYLLIWAIIKRKKGVSAETNMRLMRSLVVILCVSVGGYLINLSIYQLAFTFRHQLGHPVRIWQFTFVAAIMLNVCASANAPILYLNSTEYRKAIRTVLRDMFRPHAHARTLSSVHPIGVPSAQLMLTTTAGRPLPKLNGTI